LGVATHQCGNANVGVLQSWQRRPRTACATPGTPRPPIRQHKQEASRPRGIPPAARGQYSIGAPSRGLPTDSACGGGHQRWRRSAPPVSALPHPTTPASPHDPHGRTRVLRPQRLSPDGARTPPRLATRAERPPSCRAAARSTIHRRCGGAPPIECGPTGKASTAPRRRVSAAGRAEETQPLHNRRHPPRQGDGSLLRRPRRARRRVVGQLGARPVRGPPRWHLLP